MEIFVKMPARDILESMFMDTSLSHYSTAEEVEKFYNLAEKNVKAEVLLFTLKTFYNNFRFQQLTNTIPKYLQYQKMGQCISMEYAYFAKALFASASCYWSIIEKEFVEEVQIQGYKEFTFLNIKEKFYDPLIKKNHKTC
jgi:hypothetical protein